MTKTKSFEEYVKEELKYYDDHPDEDDQSLECHTNESMIEICYMEQFSTTPVENIQLSWNFS